MKKLSKLFLLPLVSFLSLTLFSCSKGGDAPQEETFDEEVSVSFNVNDKTIPIDKNTYGQFIEHISRCIYNGIWSEMIMDRKFYSEIGEEISQWKKGGEKNVTSDSSRTYSGGYSPAIQAGSSVFQRGISLVNKDYVGYFYACGSGSLKVSYTVNDQQVFSRSFLVSSASFIKQSYSFLSSVSGNATVTFEVLNGNVHIDSVSLMPGDNYYGMRKDSLEKLKELNAPFYRWPGGNFVSGYTWTDGIGDRDTRQSARNLHYARPESEFKTREEMIVSDIMRIGNKGFYAIIEPNDFGMDEFIKFCRYLGAEPNIVVNSGLGTAQEAANEVAYCNTINNEWANKRPSAEPYNIKYWSIGNEMNGDWQLGYCGLDTYKVRHVQFYDAMKAVDSNIEIIMVGDNASGWTSGMLDFVGNKTNYTSEHFYATRDENDAYKHIKNLKDQVENRIQKHRNLGNKVKDIHISFDEYAYDKAEVSSRLKDGMGVAACLNSMIYNNDVVDIACYSSTVNAVQGSIVTTNNEVFMEGNGFILMLYRNFFEKNALKITSASPTAPGYFEVAAAISDDKKTLTVSVINATDKNIKLNNSLFVGQIKTDFVWAPFLDSLNKENSIEIHKDAKTSSNCIAKTRSVSIFTISLAQ